MPAQKTEQPKQPEHEADYIALEEMKERTIYLTHGAKMTLGVYVGDGLFIGVGEEKTHKDRFLIVERHKDVEAGGVFGTLMPQIEFDTLPPEMDDSLYLKHVYGDLWFMGPDGKHVPVIRRRQRPGETAHGERGGFVDILAYTQAKLPYHEYPYYIGNKELLELFKTYEYTS